MFRHGIVNFCLAAPLALTFFSGHAVAQQKTLQQKLIGTWDFVRTEATQADGKKIFPFGEHPSGVNIFTEDGHFVQIQIAGGIPKFASNSRVTGTSDENKAVVQGSLALFGTYTVDEAKKMIVYKVTPARSRIGSAWCKSGQLIPSQQTNSYIVMLVGLLPARRR